MAADRDQELRLLAFHIKGRESRRRLERIKVLAGNPLEALEEAIEAIQTALHLFQPVLAVVDGPAIVRGQQEEAQGFRLLFLQELAHDNLITLALRHLAGADLHEAVVHPVARERLAGVGLRLGQLILMMRKLQIETAAVNVEGLAEELHAHGGGPDVPAPPAPSPRTGPLRLAGFGGFPKGKIAGIALLVAYLNAGAGFQLLGVAVAELAVVRFARHIEIDVAIGGVSKTLVDEPLNHARDFADVLGGARHVIDAGDIQNFQVPAIIRGYALGQLRHSRVLFLRLHDQLVVHIGDVDDKRHLIAKVGQIALDSVEDDRTDHVADVARLVDRRSAQVHADLARL